MCSIERLQGKVAPTSAYDRPLPTPIGSWPASPSLNPGRLFFLDETSVKTNMVREYGRAPRGERLVASVPHGHRKTSTFIGCLHEGGMVAP